MKTGIIIPCYNEAKRLDSDAFVHFANAHEAYQLCFVNDGSKDDTISVLKEIQAQAKENNIEILDLEKNVGKATAVRTGAQHLFQQGEAEYIGFIDADLSTDFQDFKKLVHTLDSKEELALVYGSRGKGEGQIERNIFRNVFSKIIKLIVSFILGLPIEDTQCGAKVFRRTIIPIAYKDSFLSRWLFDIEIFIRLKKHFGRKKIMTKMYEQALERWVHVEDTKLGLKDALQIPFMLFNIWFSYRTIATS